MPPKLARTTVLGLYWGSSVFFSRRAPVVQESRQNHLTYYHRIM